MEMLAAIIRGHCNYYDVSGSFHAIQCFGSIWNTPPTVCWTDVTWSAPEIRQVSAYLELLRKGAALDEGYLELATEGCLKSRMRENCTSSSVRGSRQTLHSRNIVKGVSRRSTRLKEMDERETDGRREVAVTDIEAMVPENHLVRKIKKVMDYERGADRNDRGYLSWASGLVWSQTHPKGIGTTKCPCEPQTCF